MELDKIFFWYSIYMNKTQSSDVIEEEEIVDRIYEAIIDQRLAPNTKLSEAALCKAFNVGRMRVRRVLLMLANKGLVELRPNKGAFVASPSVKQARDVFEMRLLLEPLIIKMAAQKAKSKDIKLLEKHIHKESTAHVAGDRHAAIRLSGQFHAALAVIADNQVMLQTVKDLITQSSLIIGMFGASGVTNCREDEHAQMLQAIKTCDAGSAEQLMIDHICHIRDQIDFENQRSQTLDLVSLFS